MDSSAGGASPSPHTPPPTPRAVWIALILLASAIVAGAAGLLANAAGASMPASVLASGAAFAGTVALMLSILNFALGKS